MWLYLFFGLLAYGQSDDSVTFEGADIQGELNQADLALLGQRAPWVIPVPLKPPLNMNHHLRLPPAWPVTTRQAEPVAPPTKRRKKKKRKRYGNR